MKKLIAVSVLLLAQLCTGQLNCRFLRTRVAEENDYLCMLSRATIDPAAESFTFIGEHESGKTDANIKGVLITDSQAPVLTKALIKSFYERFPNIQYFEVFHSRLQRIEPGAFEQSESALNTKNLVFLFNNLTSIDDGAFDGLRNLELLRIVNSRVETIGDGAFRQLEKVKKLDMKQNSIRTLPKKLLNAMFFLGTVDFSNNLLEVIDGDIFYCNSEVQYIYLSYNEINAIGEDFFAGLHIFNDISIYKNKCVDGTFKYREAAMRGLAICFNNYQSIQTS